MTIGDINLLPHFIVKFVGGTYYESETETHYYYPNKIKTWASVQSFYLKRWATSKYYNYQMWKLSRKAKTTYRHKCIDCGSNWYSCLCTHEN